MDFLFLHITKLVYLIRFYIFSCNTYWHAFWYHIFGYIDITHIIYITRYTFDLLTPYLHSITQHFDFIFLFLLWTFSTFFFCSCKTSWVQPYLHLWRIKMARLQRSLELVNAFYSFKMAVIYRFVWGTKCRFKSSMVYNVNIYNVTTCVDINSNCCAIINNFVLSSTSLSLCRRWQFTHSYN